MTDKTGAIHTLLKALAPLPTEAKSHPSPIDLPPASRLYKNLLQGGHFNHSTQRVERVPSVMWDATTFAVEFVNEVGREATVGMCVGKGNGAFVVAELVEALNRGLVEGEEGRKREIGEALGRLKDWFGEEEVEEVERGEAKGKKVLVEKFSLL
jgi:pumilio family protein 6